MVDPQEHLCQWITPPAVAGSFLEWSNVQPSDLLLEPSAGEGALIPLGHPNVLAFELDPERASELRYWRPQAQVVCASFLDFPTPPSHVADVCVQNPPYSHSGESVFLERALRWAPRSTTLIRSAALHGTDRQTAWRNVEVTRLAFLIHRPRFLGPYGLPTKFSPAYDYVAVEARLRDSNREPVRPEVAWVNWR